jgi:D-inositol-3-phosphate glycosyltransferase
VEDNKTGFLVPPNEPLALARKIRQFFYDHSLRASMRLNAINRVNSFFTWSHVAGILKNIYAAVLAGEKPQEQMELLEMEEGVYSR